VTKREEEIRARIKAVEDAPDSGPQLHDALDVANAHALKDVAFLLGVLNAIRNGAPA
jgi:hypothetical protein